MDEPPVCKRPRMLAPAPAPALPSDPCIPLPDGLSPFSTLAEDLVNHIFLRYTGDVKSKMKLLLVCEKFGTQIKKRICWSREDKLKLSGDEVGGWINDTRFTTEQIPNALLFLLERIMVRTVVIGDVCFGRLNGLSICGVIDKHHDKFSLEYVGIETGGDNLDCLQFLISSLISCGLSKVKSLSTVFHLLDERFLDHLLPLIMYCQQNLCFLKITVEENYDDISYPELCHSLAKCSKLHTLQLETYLYNEDDLPTIAMSFNSLKNLRNLNLNFPMTNPSLFTSLTEDCRSRIERISRFSIDDADADQAIWNSFMEGAINLFPNLLELKCRHDHKWDVDTVVSTVTNIFNNFSNRSRRFFKLGMIPKNVYRCLTRLTKKDGLNAKIMIEDGVYKCFKGDVEILLEIGV